jgi:3-dehydroquinate dehydratase
LFRTSTDQKIVITPTRPEDGGYNYASSKERLQKIMETPPTDQAQQQEDPTYPYGLPTFDRKD